MSFPTFLLVSLPLDGFEVLCFRSFTASKYERAYERIAVYIAGLSLPRKYPDSFRLHDPIRKVSKPYDIGGMPPPENRFSMTGTSSLAGRAAVLARCFQTGLLSLRTVLGKWPARLSIGIDGQTTSALGWYKHRVCCGSGAH